MDLRIKKIAFFFMLLAVSVIVLRQIFKAMNLSLVDYPSFTYTGLGPKKEWFNYVNPLAKSVGDEFGIPWQAIAAQTALETGWGKSKLFQNYNNWGGIKAVKNQISVQFSTSEFIGGKETKIVDGFRTWETPYSGLRGYAQFLKSNKRYSKAFNYPNNPKKFIEELKKAGYATDPDYISKVNSIIDQNVV